MKSILQDLNSVPFPAHIGERVYMRGFYKRDGLPSDLQRWQSTIDAMLANVDTAGPIYLMIDQGYVRAGTSHRRQGLHIDGYWMPEKLAHGSHHQAPRHHPAPKPSPRHIHMRDGAWDTGPKWSTDIGNEEWAPEAIILASDVQACRAYEGEYDGIPSHGGDCSHIDTRGMRETFMRSGVAYAGNVCMLHESLPIAQDCLRTVVRLNVPGWSPEL